MIERDVLEQNEWSAGGGRLGTAPWAEIKQSAAGRRKLA